FLHFYGSYHSFHSFPTRRSSDLFVLVGELQHVDEIADVRFAIDAEQADRRRNRRLRRPRGRALERRERLERALVADLSERHRRIDRKSTRLNSSHRTISYAVFCL